MSKTVLIFLIFSITTLLLPVLAFAQSAVQVSGSFSPASVTAAANADFTIEVRMVANQAMKAQVFSINTSFDTSQLQLKSITYMNGWQKSDNLGGDRDNIADINNRVSPAEIKLIGEFLNSGGFSLTAGQPVSVASVVFTVKQTQQTNINIANTSTIIQVKPDTSLQTLPLSSSALVVNQTGVQPALSCSGFDPKDFGTQAGSDLGVPIYEVNGGSPHQSLLDVTPALQSQPAGTVINTPVVAVRTSGAPGLVSVTPSAGNWYVSTAVNTNITTDYEYTVTTSGITNGSISKACTRDHFILRVTHSPPDTSCPATITLTQVRGRLHGSSDAWSTAPAITAGQTLDVAGFHNNTSSPASDVSLSYTGPAGSTSTTQDISPDTVTHVGTIAPVAGTYTLTAQVPGATGTHASNCTGIVSLTVNTPAVVTTSFRIAENPSDFTDTGPHGWQPYIVEPTSFDFTFSNTTPGQKFIWVEFRDSTGKTERHNTQIQIQGPEPAITGCSLGFEGTDTILNLTGQHFGTNKGTVTTGEDNTSLTVRKWKDNSVQAVFPNAPVGQSIPVTLTNTDGQVSPEGSCSSISLLNVGASYFCHAPQDKGQSNVEVAVVENVRGAKPVKQTVGIDKKGNIQGLTINLQEGHNYKLSLKAPKSVRKVSDEFTASLGTTNLTNFTLPVGDIFPLDGGDGRINSFDHNELVREWNAAGDAAGRPGDFNQDGKINSIDWSCMRQNFNDSDDPELAPSSGVPASTSVPAASSSPASSPGPSASSSVSPSPSPSSSPGPSPSASTIASPSPSSSPSS